MEYLEGYMLLFDIVKNSAIDKIGKPIKEDQYLYSAPEEIKDALCVLLEELNYRDKDIMKMFCGIEYSKRYSFQEIADMYELSQSDVSIITKNAADKLSGSYFLRLFLKNPDEFYMVNKLGLSIRVLNVLSRYGIRTIDELIDIVDNHMEELKKWRFIGEKAISEILESIVLYKSSLQNK